MNRLFSSVAISVLVAAVVLCQTVCAQKGDPQQQAYFRYAMKNDGDVTRGEQLFLTHRKLLCTNCHNVTGKEKSGPNLEGIGDKFERQQLIEQVLFPNKSIKPGFEQVVIVTKDGLTHVGRIERVNKAVHRIIDVTGKQKDIPSQDVEHMQVSSTSLMPEDLVSAISREEFADLMAYMRTLSFGVHQGLVADGKSIDIKRLKTPVTFRPIHSPDQAFENPVWCGALPGTDSDLLVIEHHTSKIWRLIRDGDSVTRVLFLDLASETYLSNNQGLMCLTFHPDYVTNRRYFLKHEVKEDGEVKTTVVERRGSKDGLSDSGVSSRRLLDVVQQAFNHNGGCLGFGPDGMLYIGFGDGGPQKDPPGYAQNPRIFHGSILRIDVDKKDPGRPYAVPPDNPFVDAYRRDSRIQPETWATGFREPWRFSFDVKTGELYVGDVGQDTFEEVSIVKRGQNQGWNVREGFAPFSEEYRRAGETYTDPLFAYKHGLGFSVTGGFVYRGKQNDSFDGVYIFGDYNTRRVWGLRQQNGVVQTVAEIGTAPGGVASFGIDQQGEIYLVTYMGTVFHVDLAATAFPAAP
ncbi:MAG TPA: c-type cytochrome [Planctomycetes bacterium]|nr:c-type cytochrome [Planctomycetota bacterium]